MRFESNLGPVEVEYDAETDALCVFLGEARSVVRDVDPRQSAPACLLHDFESGALVGVEIYNYSTYPESSIQLPGREALTLPPFHTLTA